jgi:hypothetical protein
VRFAITLGLVLAGCGSTSSNVDVPDSAPPPPPGDDAGDAGNAPLAIAAGDVAELTVTNGVAGGTFATPSGKEQLVVVIASTRLDTSGDELAWSIDTTKAPDGANATIATGCSMTSAPWSSTVVPPETPPSGTTTVIVGDTRTFHAPTPTGFEDITVQALAVGAHSIVWADTTAAHPAVLDPAFVTQFLSDFDNTILPRERTVFGIESDLDGDGHIGLVFTPLTYKTSVAFFSGCDLVSFKGCATKNGGEFLWLTPPNAIDPPYNTPNAIKEILAHETSHLVHFNRKVLRNSLTTWPDSEAMIEGVGGFAQDVIGPQAGNLYVAMAGLDGIKDFSLGDLIVDSAAYDSARDGVVRGGSYLFVRWLYDRAGGDAIDAAGTITGKGGIALLRALLDVKDSIATTLATKATLADVTTDFYTTLAMSNQNEAGGAAPTNSCFAYLPVVTDPITKTPHGADPHETFHGMQMNGPAISQAKSGQVRAGGVAYVSAPAKSGTDSLALTVKVDTKAAPRVRVGRIK